MISPTIVRPRHIKKGFTVTAWNSNGYPTQIKIIGIENIPSYYMYAQNSSQNAFYNVTDLDLGGAKQVYGYAFYNFRSLVNVDLSEIEVIGQQAFYGCTSLAKIDLSSTTELYAYAFQSCASLMEVNIDNGTPATIAANSFANVPGNCVFYVPLSALATYRAATNWSDRASYIHSKVSIAYTLENVSGAAANPTHTTTAKTETLTFTAASGYALPDTVTVTGATGTWTKATGTLVLSNVTGNIAIAVTGTN